MGFEGNQLHLFCFPFMIQGHMIPMVDMAKKFAERGVKVTIITTPFHSSSFEKAIQRARSLGHQINTHLLESSSYSSIAWNHDSIPSFEFFMNLIRSLDMLQKPLEQLVEAYCPDCIISDVFLPWTVDVAAKFDIPRLSFNGSSFFSACVMETILRCLPHKDVSSDTETFVLPGLPHAIELTRSQIPSSFATGTEFFDIWERIKQSDLQSFGVVMNSFYELEPAYVDYYRKELGHKAWHIGPVSLFNRDAIDMAERGKKASIAQEDCLNWLDKQTSSSVAYVCFGSLCHFPAAQLIEIALALETLDCPFIWAVGNNANLNDSKWLPADGFEERIKGKGLLIRGWAPQLLILNHPAIGAFVTHCGWNSLLEGISAGVAMVTWPMFAEQFYNEKLITQVLKIGVQVGSTQWVLWHQEERPLISGEKIVKALNRVMGDGEEAQGMRKRARELKELALTAVGVGGSSYLDMGHLIDELKMCGQKKPKS